MEPWRMSRVPPPRAYSFSPPVVPVVVFPTMSTCCKLACNPCAEYTLSPPTPSPEVLFVKLESVMLKVPSLVMWA